MRVRDDHCELYHSQHRSFSSDKSGRGQVRTELLPVDRLAGKGHGVGDDATIDRVRDVCRVPFISEGVERKSETASLTAERARRARVVKGRGLARVKVARACSIPIPSVAFPQEVRGEDSQPAPCAQES